MNMDSADPRMARWASILKEFDAWRTNPSAANAPSANSIAIRVDELMRDTLGIVPEDPRIIEARCILELADEFKSKYGSAGTFAAAGHLFGLTNEWLVETAYVAAARHRFFAIIRDTDYDAPLDEGLTDHLISEGATGLLRGEARYHEDVTTGLLGPSIARLFKEDALNQSKGDDSLIRRKIPARNRQNRLSTLLDMGRGLSIVRAHYDAGFNAISWLKAHEILIPNIPAETRRGWNKKVDRKLREIAHTAGGKAVRQSPLDEDENAITTYVQRYTAEEFRAGLSAISKAGSEKAE
jgi:hypothetical protein